MAAKSTKSQKGAKQWKEKVQREASPPHAEGGEGAQGSTWVPPQTPEQTHEPGKKVDVLWGPYFLEGATQQGFTHEHIDECFERFSCKPSLRSRKQYGTPGKKLSIWGPPDKINEAVEWCMGILGAEVPPGTGTGAGGSTPAQAAGGSTPAQAAASTGPTAPEVTAKRKKAAAEKHWEHNVDVTESEGKWGGKKPTGSKTQWWGGKEPTGSTTKWLKDGVWIPYSKLGYWKDASGEWQEEGWTASSWAGSSWAGSSWEEGWEWQQEGLDETPSKKSRVAETAKTSLVPRPPSAPPTRRLQQGKARPPLQQQGQATKEPIQWCFHTMGVRSWEGLPSHPDWDDVQDAFTWWNAPKEYRFFVDCRPIHERFGRGSKKHVGSSEANLVGLAGSVELEPFILHLKPLYARLIEDDRCKCVDILYYCNHLRHRSVAVASLMAMMFKDCFELGVKLYHHDKKCWPRGEPCDSCDAVTEAKLQAAARVAKRWDEV